MATSLKPRFSKREMMGPMRPRWSMLSVNVVKLGKLFRVRYKFGWEGCVRTWTPSGLMAMKLEQLISLTGSEG